MTVGGVEWDLGREEAPRLLDCGASELISYETRLDGSFAWVHGTLLEPASPSTSSVSDSPLARRLLDVYDDSGLDTPIQLRGSFLAVLWDAGKRRLLAFRDAIGLGPGYYSLCHGQLRISPDMEWILGGERMDRAVNRYLIAELLRLRFHPLQETETFYEHVSRLHPARLMTVQDGNVRFETFWNPLPDGFSWNDEAELERFPELLRRSVASCLEAGADSLALSGGFDSVSLAVLANEMQRPTGTPPLHALSLILPPPCDEQSTQTAVADGLGMPQSLIPLQGSLESSDILEKALALSEGSPGPVLSLWQSLYHRLLAGGRRLGLKHLMFGTGGDDLLNVDPSYGADCLVSLRWRALWDFFQSARRTSPFSTPRVARIYLWSGALRPSLISAMSRGLGWIPATRRAWLECTESLRARRHPWLVTESSLGRQLRQRWEAARPSSYGPWGESYLAALRGLIHHPLAMLELEQGAAWTAQAGFRQSLPFFDRDLVTHLLRTHPQDLIAGGTFKTPLRRLVRERLSHIRLPSKKVDFSNTVHRALRGSCLRRWRRTGGEALASLGIIHESRADDLVSGYARGRHDQWLPTWLLLTCESWLQANAGRGYARERNVA